jgi:glyoxylase-like metal-dependent hydrolase (beta-lactamase superfamily II)
MLEREVAEGIHRVEDAYTNWYLVEDGGQLTVVDTGLPRSWRSLQAALQELGRTQGDIAAVVITHAHFDHMGFAERARKELGVPVLVHEREVSLAGRPWRYEHERARLPYFFRYPRFIKIFSAMGAAGALSVKGCEDVRTFGSDDELDVPGRPRVVFSPGHTHGHSALHFPERDALIAGDAVVTFDPYTTREGAQIVSGAATADSEQALASLDRLAATDARVVLTGHGDPWRRGARQAAEAAKAAGPS